MSAIIATHQSASPCCVHVTRTSSGRNKIINQWRYKSAIGYNRSLPTVQSWPRRSTVTVTNSERSLQSTQQPQSAQMVNMHLVNRRSMFLLTAAAAAISGPPLNLTTPPPAQAAESLFTRISTTTPLQPPPGGSPFAPRQIYYPPWMFGEWQITSQLVSATAPLGRKLLPRSAAPLPQDPLQEPPLSYTLRFYSTFPDTLDNQVRFALGVLPQDAVIADRAYNTRQLGNATLGFEGIEQVEYDPRTAPDRETVSFARIAPDMRPLPPRRLELYLSKLRTETRVSEDGTEEFATAECCRQVLVAAGRVETNDYEIINLYTREPGGKVTGRQRVAVFLQPQDAAYFEAGGRAVQVLDYDLGFEKVLTEGGRGMRLACVETPKQVVQCI